MHNDKKNCPFEFCSISATTLSCTFFHFIFDRIYVIAVGIFHADNMHQCCHTFRDYTGLTILTGMKVRPNLLLNLCLDQSGVKILSNLLELPVRIKQISDHTILRNGTDRFKFFSIAPGWKCITIWLRGPTIRTKKMLTLKVYRPNNRFKMFKDQTIDVCEPNLKIIHLYYYLWFMFYKTYFLNLNFVQYILNETVTA